jgi:hypothetical protein
MPPFCTRADLSAHPGLSLADRRLPGLPLPPGKPTCSLFRGPLRACPGRECPPALRLGYRPVRFFGEMRTDMVPRTAPSRAEGDSGSAAAAAEGGVSALRELGTSACARMSMGTPYSRAGNAISNEPCGHLSR